MRKRLYVAYGSNLNFRQMEHRCPTAKLYGTGTIDGYELQFKGISGNAFATIAPKEGAAAPAAVWRFHGGGGTGTRQRRKRANWPPCAKAGRGGESSKSGTKMRCPICLQE